MSIPEPTLVIYCEPPKAIATTDLGDYVAMEQKTMLSMKTFLSIHHRQNSFLHKTMKKPFALMVFLFQIQLIKISGLWKSSFKNVRNFIGSLLAKYFCI